MARKKVINMLGSYTSERFSKNDAHVIGTELTRISNNLGEVKPKDIVDDARPKRANLHPYFEWNNSIAGERYRWEQAKYMIRNVYIVDITPKKEEVLVNIMSSLNRGGDVGFVYKSTPVILANRTDRKTLLDSAWRELEGFINRYSTFVEFEPIFKIIRIQMKKHKR